MASFVGQDEVPMRESHAWRSILNVNKPADWDECAICKSPLFRVDTAPLPEGRVRKGCTFCKQRYNVKEPEELSDTYKDAGAW